MQVADLGATTWLKVFFRGLHRSGPASLLSLGMPPMSGRSGSILLKNSFHGRVKTAPKNTEPQNRSTYDGRLSVDGFGATENHRKVVVTEFFNRIGQL